MKLTDYVWDKAPRTDTHYLIVSGHKHVLAALHPLPNGRYEALVHPPVYKPADFVGNFNSLEAGKEAVRDYYENYTG